MPAMPGVERVVAAAPTDDTARTRAIDPGAMFSAGRNWTPFGMTLLGHQISINVSTGGLVVSVTDVDVAYQSLPLRVLRTYDAQEQYAQWAWIDGHPDTDPRFHLFGNWQMHREAQISEVWQSTYPEILVTDGTAGAALFYREGPDFAVHTNPTSGVEDRLRAYGVPGRTLEAVGWIYSAGDLILRTKQDGFQILTGRLDRETMMDPAQVSLWRFDPVRGLASRYTSHYAFTQVIDAAGNREVSVPALCTRIVDGLGHTLDFAPAEPAPPYRNYVMRTGAAQELRLEAEPTPLFRDGSSPEHVVRMALVARVIDLTRAENNVVAYKYDAGSLTKVSFPARDGGGWPRTFAYAYDGRGLLTSITDPVGDSVNFEYVEDLTDVDGRLTARVKLSRVTDGDGNSISYRHDYAHAKVIVTVTDADGAARSASYGYLEDVKDTGERYLRSEEIRATLGFSGVQDVRSLWEYSGDGRFLLLRATDPNGSQWQLEYNRYNQRTSTTDPTGHRRDLEYDVKTQPTATAPNAYDLIRTTETNVDAEGATFHVESGAECERYAPGTSSDPRDAAQSTHRILSRTNPNGETWRYAYDDAANSFSLMASSVTDPLGATSARRFDVTGNQTEETDATGVKRRWFYDTRGLLVATEDANANRRTWLRDPGTGWVLFATDALGQHPGDPEHSLQYFWNDAGQLLAEQDAVGARTEYEYFPSGRLRLIRRFDPVAREIGFEFDALGALTAMVDPLGRRTIFRYDEAGRLYETLRDTGLSPSLRFVMDPGGRVTAFVDRNGLSTAIGYDALGRMISFREPAWPASAPTNPGKQCQITYDRLGRRIRITDSDLPRDCTYRYDAVGNILERRGPFKGTLGWNYDAKGNLTRVTDGAGVVDLSFERDAAGRLTAVRDSAHLGPSRRFRYEWQDGALLDNLYSTVAEGVGVRGRFGYDADRQLTAVAHDRNGLDLGTFGYVYRADGLTGETTGDHVATYDYDGMKRLVSESDVGVKVGYDGAGNRLWRAGVLPPAAEMASFDGDNKLLADPVPTTSYEYDANGSRVRRRSSGIETRYTYDGGGRLAIVDTGSETLRYRYDLDGRLLERTFTDSRQSVIRQLVLGHRSVLARTDQAGRVKTLYTRDDDGRLLRRRSIDPIAGAPTADPRSLYYLTDGRQHVARLVDAEGASHARFDYDAWGNTLLATGPAAAGELFRYRSGQRDRATGLYLFGARWYEPETGAWLSSDPLLGGVILAHGDLLPRWADLANLYAYGRNNPIAFYDPDGLNATLPKGWPQPPDWKGGFKWKNEGGQLRDPSGRKWHWHPEDDTHNDHWDLVDKRGNKTRVDEEGENLGDDAFKGDQPEEHDGYPDDADGKPEDDDSSSKYMAAGGKAAGTVAVGWGLWTIAKWGAAIFFIPETGGGSLAAAAATP